ncbi:hypothetical protein NQ117_10970 [Paenibacillus sp. SC116]|uniref:phage protein n=1 Tax=Paenibacillus sp. SC116 TaxID=2968986 RepID=UPI00215ABB27|nr:hypothetical protein [Paenibacillus sp. SC116]MCR8844207.1 hypothetical protein [Paenibacillus sp. SC116]
MQLLYKRQLEVVIGGKTFKSEELTIRVRAEFDDDAEPNESTIEIYNLTKQTISSFRNEMPVVVRAGYGNDIGTILQGTIVEIRTTREQTDRLTTLQVKDVVKRKKQPVKQTYRPGTKASVILQDLMDKDHILRGQMVLSDDYTFAKGFVANGDVMESIRRVAAACGSTTYSSQGKLHFKAAGKKRAEAPILIAPDTGLIGSPERFEDGDKKKGIKITSLLNHRLRAGVKVKLESEDYKGIYEVKQGMHQASNDQFVTEVDLVT